MKVASADGVLGLVAAIGGVVLTFYLSNLHDQISDLRRISGNLPSVAAMIDERNELCNVMAYESSLDESKRGIVSLPEIDRTPWLVARSDPATVSYLGNSDALALESSFQDIGSLNSEAELVRLMEIQGMSRETVLDIGTIVSDATQRLGNSCDRTKANAETAQSNLKYKISAVNRDLSAREDEYEWRLSWLAACIAVLLLMAGLGGITNA